MAIPASRTRTFGRAAGFTYIGLLIAVVIMGIALSAVGVVWRTQGQREREQQLLFIGRDFEHAIASYYKTGRQFPRRSTTFWTTSAHRSRPTTCAGSTTTR